MKRGDVKMTEDKLTSIRVKPNVLRTLKDLGRKGESYNDIIQWLLDNRKKKRKVKSDA